MEMWVAMNDNTMKYFKIAKELNEHHREILKMKQWHFRGNRNSFSLISLSNDTPELGLSGLKTMKQGENAVEWRFEKTIGSEPKRETPEKKLQAWIVNHALNNGKILPFGKELTFLTSELAFTDVEIDSKKKKGKLVNDILAIDDNGFLWVIELKSDRQQKRLKDQVNDFIHLIHAEQAFFHRLVQFLTDSTQKHNVYTQVKGMIVWPDYKKSKDEWGSPRDDWRDIKEICYKPKQSGDGFLFKQMQA
jgi:hypothetical protein